jgi:glycosyltransferase involved in cell wall biosynthesis
MHSVFHHKDKLICEAAMPEIITHLQGGYDTLKLEKCVPGKVYVVSHGCTETIKEPKLWNYYKSTKTFMQFGFGFRYKGWENSIRATALLKQRYPDVFFTGLFSESPFSRADHQLYYDDLMDLVEQLGIQENVALLRGFQSDESLDSFLRTNQAVVFPYVSHPQHEVFGASGAARLAFSKGVATVSSNVNHFSDIPTIKAETVEELSSALESVLTDQKVKSQQIVTQNNYVKENSWDKVADRHIAIFENRYENFNKHNS